MCWLVALEPYLLRNTSQQIDIETISISLPLQMDPMRGHWPKFEGENKLSLHTLTSAASSWLMLCSNDFMTGHEGNGKEEELSEDGLSGFCGDGVDTADAGDHWSGELEYALFLD